MESALGFLALFIIAVPFILLLVFIAKTNDLTSRVRRIEDELRRLRGEPSARTAPAEPVSRPDLPPVPSAPPAPQRPAPMSVPVSPTAGEERRAGARREWEAFIGGKLLNRVGAVALIIGVGFFLKYAFDNNWITPAMRVILGGIAGVVLLLLGARFYRREYQVFAQGVIGAGIAILYLSVYASFNFYHLVSQLVAFMLMSAVTLTTFYHAFRYDSMATSVLGWAGGYLTPFLLSTGVSNEIGLFAYVDLLEAGLLACVLIRERWMVLELLTLMGTYLTFDAWFEEFYSHDALLVTALFLTLFWFLFYIAHLYRVLSIDPDPPVMRRVVHVLNAAAYFGWLYAMVDPRHHQIMGALVILLAVLYALPAALLLRRNAASSAVRDNLLTASVLAVIATSIQFSGFVTVTLWSCEALLLLWYGRKSGYHYLTLAGMAVVLVVLGKLLFMRGGLSYVPLESFAPVINRRFVTVLFVAASMWIGSSIAAEEASRVRDTSRAVLRFGGIVLLLLLFSMEVRDLFERNMFSLRRTLPPMAAWNEELGRMENLKQLSLSGVWLCFGIVLMIAGFWRRSRGVRLLAMSVLGMSVLKIFVYDLSFLQTLYRIFAFIGLGLILLAASYLYQRYKELILGTGGEMRE